MADQPRLDPFEASRFFSDGKSARPLVAGVVSRQQILDDQHFLTGGRQGRQLPVKRPTLDRPDVYADRFPHPITPPLMRRGQERFMIYCAPCHGRDGNGAGTIVMHGYSRPEPLKSDRLRQAPIGYLYDVTTRGVGTMPAFTTQVSPADRWAVVAYIRFLQEVPSVSMDEFNRSMEDQAKRFPVREGPLPHERFELIIPTDAGSGRYVSKTAGGGLAESRKPQLQEP